MIIFFGGQHPGLDQGARRKDLTVESEPTLRQTRTTHKNRNSDGISNLTETNETGWLDIHIPLIPNNSTEAQTNSSNSSTISFPVHHSLISDGGLETNQLETLSHANATTDSVTGEGSNNGFDLPNRNAPGLSAVQRTSNRAGSISACRMEHTIPDQK